MDAGYIVRWLPGQGLGDGLRITIGTEEENRGVMTALRDILDGRSLMLPFARVTIIGSGADRLVGRARGQGADASCARYRP